MISGSRAALSITVMPSASTAAIRMFSVAPTLGKVQADGRAVQPGSPCRPRCRARCPSCAPIARRPDWCMSSGRLPMASPPGSATVGLPASPHQRPEHAHRRPQPADGREVGAQRQLGRRGDAHRSAVEVDTSQPSPRSTSAISGTSRISGQFEMCGRALGQQRRGHQLEHAVLGAGHLDGARQPGPAGDQEAFHARHSNRRSERRAAVRRDGRMPTTADPVPKAAARSGSVRRETRVVRYGGAPHPHLHPDRRRWHHADWPTSPGWPRPTRGWSPTRTATRPTRRSGMVLALGHPAAGDRRGAPPGAERAVRRRRGSGHAGRRRTRSIRHCGCTEDYVAALGVGLRPLQRRSAAAGLVHPARRHAGRRAAAPGQDGGAAGGAQRVGAGSADPDGTNPTGAAT